MSILSGVLKSVLVDRVKHALSKENLNPIKTPSTGVAYTTGGALAYLVSNPPSTEYDVLLQLVTAVVTALAFFYKQHRKDKKAEK